eukprot:scaffold31469_cov60-Phaeocystis_antarctica.AAC.2
MTRTPRGSAVARWASCVCVGVTESLVPTTTVMSRASVSSSTSGYRGSMARGTPGVKTLRVRRSTRWPLVAVSTATNAQASAVQRMARGRCRCVAQLASVGVMRRCSSRGAQSSAHLMDRKRSAIERTVCGLER